MYEKILLYSDFRNLTEFSKSNNFEYVINIFLKLIVIAIMYEEILRK